MTGIMTAVSFSHQTSHPNLTADGGGVASFDRTMRNNTMDGGLHGPALTMGAQRQHPLSQYGSHERNKIPPMPQSVRGSGLPSHSRNHNEGDEAITVRSKAVNKERRDNGQTVRRRISRACDQCNQLRTKCDGQHPCAHCVEFGITCEYARERKKRGKASKKDLAAQQAAASAVTEPSGESGNDLSSEDSQSENPSARRRSDSKRRKLNDSDASQCLSPRNAAVLPANSHDNTAKELLRRPLATTLTSNATSRDHEDVSAVDDVSHHTLQPFHAAHNPIPPFSSAVQQLPLESRHALGLHMPSDEFAHTDHHQPVHSDQSHHRHLEQHANMHSHQPQHQHYQSQYGHMDMNQAMTSHPNITSRSSSMMQPYGHANGLVDLGESAFSLSSPGSQAGLSGAARYDDPGMSANYFMQSSMGGMHSWGNPQSPAASATSVPPFVAPAPPSATSSTNSKLRYPVLRPLLPYLANILPMTVACELLEAYFASVSSTFMHPQSPYVVGHVFRKRSFFRRTNPRSCSPALLASMLWLAAQTSGSAFLNSSPSVRGKTCQRLLELTISLLKPLIHAPPEGYATGHHLYGGQAFVNGVAMSNLGGPFAVPMLGLEENSPGAAGDLDDIVTYIHLSTVVSASEYKGASLRWWHAAWSLARELHLGRELPPNMDAQENAESDHREGSLTGEMGAGTFDRTDGPTWVSDEEREERRRVWWLLYIVDRHLALCYNRPLALLDAECTGLHRPEDESRWQHGEFYMRKGTSDSQNETVGDLLQGQHRPRGSGYDVISHDVYGFFAPIMTILGEIVDLHHASSHPRFALPREEYNTQAVEISRHLEAYRTSLAEFEAHTSAAIAAQRATLATSNNTQQLHRRPQDQSNDQTADIQSDLNATLPAIGPEPNHASPSPSSPASLTISPLTQRLSETALQTNIITAYGNHLYHVMHILLRGKWDPISLLDDTDLWISSPSFVEATQHAVAAADAITQILDYDPDLSFMPWFFGIYLLQGSLLLLLIADKLQGEASANVVRACEAIVRAHEACVVTLNTEYQRNFRKVMRSALAQVRGRAPSDFGDLQARRREILALYRWTGEGTGLAL